MGVLRHGGMGRLFTGVRAPSTLGTFLRAFRFGHVRQLDAVAARFLTALTRHASLVSTGAEVAFVDRPTARSSRGRPATRIDPVPDRSGSARSGHLLGPALVTGQSSMTASDQHQPASSRAMATFATTGLFFLLVKTSPVVMQPVISLVTAGRGVERPGWMTTGAGVVIDAADVMGTK